MDAQPINLPVQEPALVSDKNLVFSASKLVSLTGKQPAEWTLDDLIRICAEQKVRLISLMHVGGDGWLKALDFVPRDADHLRRILYYGERADGSSLFAGTGIRARASDIILKPRPDTAFLDPFAEDPTLAILCDHIGHDGQPLPQSGTSIVRKAYNRLLGESGIELHALGEVEFFLGKEPDETEIHGSDDRGYHAVSPFVFGQELRRKALIVLAGIGVPVKYGHSEVGYAATASEGDLIWEQHEIELALQPLPQAADNVVLTQWVVRNLAHQQGMRLSFEPVVRKGHAGSGMHFHFAASRNGRYLQITDKNGDLDPSAAWMIGGLIQYSGILMAFGNRKASSFLRLFQGKEAPTGVSWGRLNRKALVRLPISSVDETGHAVTPDTVEYRLPDGSANAHWLLAAVAQAIFAVLSVPDLMSIIKQTESSAQKKGKIPSIPKNFSEITELLQEHRNILEAGGVFPATFLDRQIELLKLE